MNTKEQLLEQAKEMGITTIEARVLSTDPYFVGTDKDVRDAEWAAALWNRMMETRKKPLHLRGFHYWVQSQGIVKPDGVKYAYEDPAKDWAYLLHCAQIARYLGIGEWKNLIDLKHPNPNDYNTYYVSSGLARDGTVDVQTELNEKLEGLVDDFLKDLLAQAPRYHTDYYQVYHGEVWCEKNSMGFVIEPACRKYQACYQPLVGQASVEKVNMAAARAVRAARAGKKVRIFYVADYDRYGWSMVTAVARKLEYFVKEEELDIKLARLALNEDQINEFNLPKAPKHGEAVVELDALEAIHPGELGKIVEDALSPYYDTEKPKLVAAENQRIREKARTLLEEKLRKPLEEAFADLDLEGMAGEISLKDTLDEEFEAPEPGHDVEESGEWMYDSRRSYWDQWEAYKRYKVSRVEEEA